MHNGKPFAPCMNARCVHVRKVHQGKLHIPKEFSLAFIFVTAVDVGSQRSPSAKSMICRYSVSFIFVTLGQSQRWSLIA